MQIIDVVKKIVGPVDPVGETHTDDARFENLITLIVVVDKLVVDIERVASNKGRDEYSMNRAGEYASKFLDDLGIVE